jgi:hypothetical protein
VKTLVAKLSLATLLLVAMAFANGVPLLYFGDRKIKAAVGDVLTFDLSVQQADRLDGGGFTLSYDPALVEVVSIDFDGHWEFKSSQSSDDVEAGLVSDMGFATFNPVSDSAPIAIITVRALAPGRTLVRTEKAAAVPFAVEGSDASVRMAKVILNIK